MRRRFTLPILLAVVFAACSSDPPAGTGPGPSSGGTSGGSEDGGGAQGPKVDVTDETLDVGGTQRTYVLAVPKSHDVERAYPLVLVFHGDGGDGPGMRRVHPIDSFSGDTAVVAYPTGLGQTWNLYEPSATNPDIAFVEALVDAIDAKVKIDRTHVFGVGYSSGGYFINQVSCRKNGFFRGIVVHAGGAPNEPEDPEAGVWPSGYVKCKDQLPAPEGGVATMAVHGENDAPEGGEFVAIYWAALNGCKEERTPTTPSPCVKFEGCPADKPVVWCLIPGMGHTIWQEGTKAGWDFIKGI